MTANACIRNSLQFHLMWKMPEAIISDWDTPLTPEIACLPCREWTRYCHCHRKRMCVWPWEIVSMTLRLFFRLDTTARTWATVPFARGSSWFCGWKESSSLWPPSTWGSRCPPSARIASWASGGRELSHRNSINEWNEAAFERFLSVIQAILHWRLSKGALRL